MDNAQKRKPMRTRMKDAWNGMKKPFARAAQLTVLIGGLAILGAGCGGRQVVVGGQDSGPRISQKDIGAAVSNNSEAANSRNFWAAVAPFAINGWKYKGSTLSLTLQNMDGAELSLSSVSFKGIIYSSKMIHIRESTYDSKLTLAPGEEKTITIEIGIQCNPGDRFSLSEVSLLYTKGNISGLLEKGDKPIIGKCS
jgi:hypothetical protein